MMMNQEGELDVKNTGSCDGHCLAEYCPLRKSLSSVQARNSEWK
jgi:hypothetical protein